MTSSLMPGRLHLDRAVRPPSLRRELPETAQGERIKAPQNPILIEPSGPRGKDEAVLE